MCLHAAFYGDVIRQGIYNLNTVSLELTSHPNKRTATHIIDKLDAFDPPPRHSFPEK